MEVDKSKFNNSGYNPGASFLKRSIWYFVNVLFFLNPLITSYRLKRWLLKVFGAKIGKRLVIKPGVNIKYPWFLKVGDYVGIGEKVWIDNLAKVEIGSHATISQGAMLLTGNHDYKSIAFDLITGCIKIEYGAWIGAQAVVCPGVVCGSHSILSVGSIATKDLDPYLVYQGNPARPVRKRIIEL